MQERMHRFSRLVHDCYKKVTSIEEMIEVIRAKDRYSVLLRAAALRLLVGNAPLEVTKGRPFGQRRRLVRTHYKV